MSTSHSDTTNSELSLTSSDIYRASDEGVLLQADAERLVQWGYEQRFNRSVLMEPMALAPEQRKGFNLVTVAYYFGAMLMISACAWFLGDKWEALGSPGIFSTTLVYMMVAVGTGWWLRKKGYVVGGGLLITVAVCLVPLLTYTIEDMIGLWPSEHPGSYKNYYPWINGSWIVMELATIAAAAIALRYVRFGFLGWADSDGQWVRGCAWPLRVTEHRVHLVGNQAAPFDLPGIWSARSAPISWTSCL